MIEIKMQEKAKIGERFAFFAKKTANETQIRQILRPVALERCRILF